MQAHNTGFVIEMAKAEQMLIRKSLENILVSSPVHRFTIQKIVERLALYATRLRRKK